MSKRNFWFILLGLALVIGIVVSMTWAQGLVRSGESSLGSSGLTRDSGRSLGIGGISRPGWPAPKDYWFAANHGLQNNWGQMIGIDTNDGVLDSTSITATISERIEYADNPGGWLSAEFVSNTAFLPLQQAKSHNPDFQYLLYFNFAHVDSTLPNDPDARPFHAWKNDTLTPWIAKDLQGENFAVWFAAGETPGTDPPTTYAVDYVTDTDPPAADTDRIDTYLEGWWNDFVLQWDPRPQGVMLDYIFDPSYGFQWYEAANDSLDLDGDGLSYRNDTNEQAAFKAAQQYYIDKIRLLGGTNFLIVANGRDSWPDEGDDAEVLSRLDGFYAEKYPETVWSAIQWGDALTQLWEEQQNHPYRRTEPVMLLDANNLILYSANKADDSRFSALLFDAQWFPRVTNAADDDAPKLNDVRWDALSDSLGASLSDAFLQSGTAGHATDPYVFRRLFENRYLDVTVDNDAAQDSNKIQGEIKNYASADTFFVDSFNPVSGDTTKVGIVFSDNVDTNTASIVSNYTIGPSGYTITDADPVAATITTLTVSPKLTEGQAFEFTAQNVESEAGAVLAPGTGAIFIGRDFYPPWVTSITQPDTSSYKLRVAFSDTMNMALATAVPGWYTTSSGLTGDSVDSVGINTVDITWDGAMANLVTDTLYISTSVQDDNGNGMVAGNLWQFTTLDSRPYVTLAEQSNSQSDLIIVRFSEALAEDTADSTAWYTIEPDSIEVESVGFYDTYVEITTASAIPDDILVTITVALTIEDLEGNPLNPTFNSQPFQSGDFTAPSIVSSGYVDPNSLEITFDDDMQSTTALDTTNYARSPAIWFSTSSPIVRDNQKHVQLNFAENLQTGTNYEITVSGLLDDNGNAIAAPGTTNVWVPSAGGGCTLDTEGCAGCPVISSANVFSGYQVQITANENLAKEYMDTEQTLRSGYYYRWDGEAWADSQSVTGEQTFGGDNVIYINVPSTGGGFFSTKGDTLWWYKLKLEANTFADADTTFQDEVMSFVFEDSYLDTIANPHGDPPVTGLFFGACEDTTGQGDPGGGDETPPSLASVTIPDSISAQLTFDEVIDATTGNDESNIEFCKAVDYPDSLRNPGTATTSGSRITLSLDNQLDPETYYTFSVNSIEDDSGNAMTEADTLSAQSPPRPDAGEVVEPEGTGVITSVVGTISDGESVTINGSNFGSNPLDYGWNGVGSSGWIETGTPGTDINKLGVPNLAAHYGDPDGGIIPEITNDPSLVRTGQQAINVHDIGSANSPDNRAWEYRKPAGETFRKVHVSYWFKSNWKNLVLNGDTGCDDGIPSGISNNINWKHFYLIGARDPVTEAPIKFVSNCSSFSYAFPHLGYTLGNLNVLSQSDWGSGCIRGGKNCGANVTSWYLYCLANAYDMWGRTGPDCYWLNRGGTAGSGASLPDMNDNWNYVSYYFDSGTVDEYNGNSELWLYKELPGQTFTKEHEVWNVKYHASCCDNGNSQWGYWHSIGFYNLCFPQSQSTCAGAQGSLTDLDVIYDDVHIQFQTQARIMLTNNAVLTQSTDMAFQPATAWNDTSITIEFNQATFDPGQTAYLYMIDGEGEWSDPAEVTIGATVGSLLESEMGSATEITNPAVGPSGAITGSPSYVTGEDGNATQFPTDATFGQGVVWGGAAFDFDDPAGDGARVDMNIRFDSDPKAHSSGQWILYDNFSGTSKAWAWEMNSSGGEQFPVLFMSSSDGTNTDRTIYGSTQPFKWYNSDSVANTALWDGVDQGEWHWYTALWRGNGQFKDEMWLFIDGELMTGAFNGNLPTADDSTEGAIDARVNMSVDDIYSFDNWDFDNHSGRLPALAWPDSVFQKYPLFDGAGGDNSLSVSDANITFEFSYFETDSTTARCIVYMNDTAVDTVNNVARLAHVESDPIPAAGSISNGDNTWRCDCAGLTGPTWTFDYQGN